MKELVNKIRRKWMKLRLQPIRVYCLHHVCAEFDADVMNACDWMQFDEFKTKVKTMQQNGVEFISLSDAYKHICNDHVRCKKYAVLAFDDGYASLKEILPWLEERQIPVTLFINGKYLDGKSYRKNPNEKYLTEEELFSLTSSFVEIGSHGWEHKRATEMTAEEFAESVKRNIDLLSGHPNYIPFWAYTYGSHSNNTDDYLHRQGLVPLYIDGMKNYNEINIIHRELL
ncbi:MAG: polysaccharide deacetylase family protein [Paludibacteraceae bacterium]|nr:polysaccharide deacetylase family protein [Paludibacteraceae bacterium]